MDALTDMDKTTTLKTNQVEILIRIDFFSEFGNQRELLMIKDLFNGMFKKGQAKQIKKELVDGTDLEITDQAYAVGITKSGGIAKNYTLLDVSSIMRGAEDMIKKSDINDFSDIEKVKYFAKVMGYIGYTTGKEEDRRKLYVMDVFPVVRRKDNKQFGYSILTKSIGSGVESRFTVMNSIYNKEPIHKEDIIYCRTWAIDGKYFRLTGYSKI